MPNLTPARRVLADQITAIIVDLPPTELDGDTIVARLVARFEARRALADVAQELNAEALRDSIDGFADVLAGAVRQIGKAASDAMRPRTAAESADSGDTVTPNEHWTEAPDGRSSHHT